MGAKTLKGRIVRLELKQPAPSGALPIVVPAELLQDIEARRLRDLGYTVISFEQMVEAAV